MFFMYEIHVDYNTCLGFVTICVKLQINHQMYQSSRLLHLDLFILPSLLCAFVSSALILSRLLFPEISLILV